MAVPAGIHRPVDAAPTSFFDQGWGTDTVTDFHHGADRLDLRTLPNLSSFSQLSITQSGADTKIGYGGDYIVLKNVAPTTIDAHDILV